MKQDISSFRFEVLGLLKGNKLPNSQASKHSKEYSSLAESAEGSESGGSEKVKKKSFSLFDVTTMIHPRAVARASRPHIQSNGSAMMVTESTKEKQKKVNFVTDIKKFGFFHKQSKNSSNEHSTNKIYSISEEVSRQQAEEQSEKDTGLREKTSIVNCELNIQSLNKMCLVSTNQQTDNETVESKLNEEAVTSEMQKTHVQNSDSPLPKDFLGGDQEISSTDFIMKQTIIQDNYMTTRL